MFTNENNCDYFNELICRIREDKEKGMEEFYNTYIKLIKSVAMSVCEDEYLADVTCNTVLIKVWKNIYNNDLYIRSPIGWLCKITKNASKDLLRANKKSRKNIVIDENLFASKDQMQEIIDYDEFTNHISHLKENEKIVVIKKVIGQEGFKEIAKFDHKPTSTVSTIYYRAIGKVKEKLEKTKK